MRISVWSSDVCSSDLLQRALARLPANTRGVLWLYHAEGYTHEEIAALMQRTPSFSKSQLARGTRRLRPLLQIEDHDHASPDFPPPTSTCRLARRILRAADGGAARRWPGCYGTTTGEGRGAV